MANVLHASFTTSVCGLFEGRKGDREENARVDDNGVGVQTSRWPVVTIRSTCGAGSGCVFEVDTRTTAEAGVESDDRSPSIYRSHVCNVPNTMAVYASADAVARDMCSIVQSLLVDSVDEMTHIMTQTTAQSAMDPIRKRIGERIKSDDRLQQSTRNFCLAVSDAGFDLANLQTRNARLRSLLAECTEGNSIHTTTTPYKKKDQCPYSVHFLAVHLLTDCEELCRSIEAWARSQTPPSQATLKALQCIEARWIESPMVLHTFENCEASVQRAKVNDLKDCMCTVHPAAMVTSSDRGPSKPIFEWCMTGMQLVRLGDIIESSDEMNSATSPTSPTSTTSTNSTTSATPPRCTSDVQKSPWVQVPPPIVDSDPVHTDGDPYPEHDLDSSDGLETHMAILCELFLLHSFIAISQDRTSRFFCSDNSTVRDARRSLILRIATRVRLTARPGVVISLILKWRREENIPAYLKVESAEDTLCELLDFIAQCAYTVQEKSTHNCIMTDAWNSLVRRSISGQIADRMPVDHTIHTMRTLIRHKCFAQDAAACVEQVVKMHQVAFGKPGDRRLRQILPPILAELLDQNVVKLVRTYLNASFEYVSNRRKLSALNGVTGDRSDAECPEGFLERSRTQVASVKSLMHIYAIYSADFKAEFRGHHRLQIRVRAQVKDLNTMLSNWVESLQLPNESHQWSI